MTTQYSPSASPDVNGAGAFSFNLDESSVSAWLQNLPVGDQLETCKSVYATLHNFNGRQVAIRERFGILEKFRKVVFWESSYLATRLRATPLPLDTKTRKIAKLAVRFHSELASGYQLVASDDEFDRGFSGYEQALVLHRILRSLGMSLLRIAQMYEPASSGIWQQLKDLYQKAESRQLLDLKIQDPVVPVPYTSTFAGLAGSIVLFTLATPCRYSQTEMENLYALFEAQSDQIDWRKDYPGPGDSLFGMDLDNSLPPCHQSALASAPKQSWRGIQPLKFLAAISAPERTRGSQPAALQENILSRVLHHLGSAKKIKIKTVGTDSVLALGLDNIATILRAEDSKPSVPRTLPAADWLLASNFELLPLTEDASKQQDSLRPNFSDRLLDQKSRNQRVPSVHSLPSGAATTKTEIGASTLRCEVHRSDLPGHALVELHSAVLAIGQVIALKSPGSPVLIGVVRWKQENVDSPYHYYGVEHLTSLCSLVNVFISSRKHTDILLLEKNASGFTDYSLILPPTKYRCGTRLTVKQPRATRNFVVEKLLESNQFFYHYALKEAHRAE
ncbi:MAG: hypothetical protein ACU843_03435 [Gammaproteobacteria bacterium]